MIDENEIPENININTEEPNILAFKDLDIKKEEDNPNRIEDADDLHEIKAADDIAEPDPEAVNLSPLDHENNSATDKPSSEEDRATDTQNEPLI